MKELDLHDKLFNRTNEVMAKNGRFGRLFLVVIGVIAAEISQAQIWDPYLGGKSINAIVWDPYRHVLWFATGGDGVIRFDGTNFKEFTQSATAGGLVNNNLTTAVIDYEGDLWFGTTKPELIRFKPDSNRWETYTPQNTQGQLISQPITALAAEKSGVIWIGTNGGGVNRFDWRRNLWQKFTSGNGLNNDYVLSIAVDDSGNTWLGLDVVVDEYGDTKGGVSRRDAAGKWVLYLNEKRINAIYIELVGKQLHKWFAATDNVYHLLPNNRDFDPRPGQNKPASLSNFTCIIVDEDGSKWFGCNAGTGGAVARLDSSQTQWKIFNDVTNVSDRRIKTIALDEDGDLWFGATQNQGAVKQSANWVTYTRVDGLGQNTVEALTQDSTGNIWAGTLEGLAKLNSTRWNNFQFTGVNQSHITTLAVDSVNTLWIGTSGGGVIHAVSLNNPPIGDTTYTFGSLEANVIKDIAIFHREIWFATLGGLRRFRSDLNQWDHFTASDSGLIDNRVQAVAVEKNGTVWCGTAAGVSRFDRKTWRRFTTANEDSLSGDFITDILIDKRNGEIWFATNSNGVSRYRDGRWRKPITFLDGLADNHVNALLQTTKPAGIWFGTSNGASFFDDSTKTRTTITKQHGLGENDVRALLQDRQYRVWFGTFLYGLTRYHRKPNRPRVDLLTRFDVTTSSEVLYKFIGSDIGTSTHLLRYAYKVEKIDSKGKIETKGYSSWTSNTFASIPLQERGSYVFQVKTIDIDGNQSSGITDTFFKIAPDTGSYTSFIYKNHSRGLNFLEVKIFWPPNQFTQDPKITIDPDTSSALDSLALFAFNLTSEDRNLKSLKKPMPLTISFQLEDNTNGKLWGIYQEQPKRVKLSSDSKNNGEIATVIRELGRYSIREITDQDGSFAQPESIIATAQPRIFSPSGGGHGPQTTISFKLDQPEHVRIQVYNLAGRLVKTVCNETLLAGINAVAWDGKDKNGDYCPTGLYIVTLESKGFQSAPPKPIKVMIMN